MNQTEYSDNVSYDWAVKRGMKLLCRWKTI